MNDKEQVEFYMRCHAEACRDIEKLEADNVALREHEELWRETVEKQDARIMELENENVALGERIEYLQWDIEERAGGGY
jgi:hypothetical protein